MSGALGPPSTSSLFDQPFPTLAAAGSPTAASGLTNPNGNGNAFGEYTGYLDYTMQASIQLRIRLVIVYSPAQKIAPNRYQGLSELLRSSVLNR